MRTTVHECDLRINALERRNAPGGIAMVGYTVYQRFYRVDADGASDFQFDRLTVST